MSDLDTLQTIWREAETSRPDMIHQLEALKTRAAKLNRKLMWRDVREIGAAALIAVFFSAVAWFSADLRGVALGMVGAAAWVAAVLLGVRLRYRRPSPAASVRDALVAEHGWLRAQVTLLRWAGLWYALPLLAAAALFNVADEGVRPVYLTALVLFGLFLIWLNWKSATALSVTRDAFAAQIHDLDHV